MKKDKIDYRLWFIVAVAFILIGPIGAFLTFLIYVWVDRHNKKKVIK